MLEKRTVIKNGKKRLCRFGFLILCVLFVMMSYRKVYASAGCGRGDETGNRRGHTAILLMHDDFDYLNQNGTKSEAEKTVLGIGATVYQMLLKIGIYGVVISLMLCGISFLIKGNDSKERSELKMWLVRIGIVFVVMASLTSIAGLIGGLFTGLF